MRTSEPKLQRRKASSAIPVELCCLQKGRLASSCTGMDATVTSQTPSQILSCRSFGYDQGVPGLFRKEAQPRQRVEN
jgi:hypothetical protein